MSTVHVVIGANYGDEGKGLMTDYLCARESAHMVVRFNGGAQAGHTVTTPDGLRHAFHHFGSGSFLGVPTFLSQFFLVNPILFDSERETQLEPDEVFDSQKKVQYDSTVPLSSYTEGMFVDPRALVTLPIDMLINQASVRKIGFSTCGVGVNETMQRSKHERYRLTVVDMLDSARYNTIMAEYAPQRLKALGLDLPMADYWHSFFVNCAERFLKSVVVTRTPPGARFVFEGAQGLMLDQDSGDYPFVTHSHTGLKNALSICREWGISDRIELVYVTRSYLTRHGDGPLPNESQVPGFVVDKTNFNNPFQGPLRFAPLDADALNRRIDVDARGFPRSVAVTCTDQYEDASVIRKINDVKFMSSGPTRADVREIA